MNAIVKKIILKGAILLLPFFGYYFCWNAWLIHTRNFSNDGISIYHAIDKSKKKVEKKKIIFGDSAGGQLYPNNQDKCAECYSLTTSGPSSLVGSYVMLENFINVNGTKGRVFYCVMSPAAMDERLYDGGTYNHFVKPFYILENFKWLTPSVHVAVREFPYWYAAQIPFIKISDWEPECEFSHQWQTTISPLYAEYFKKIQELAEKNHFQFYMLMPVLRESRKTEDYSEIKKVIRENGLEEIFSRYFFEVKYLPDDQFHDNSSHYLNPSSLGDNPLGI